jgi:RNA polymerase sigma-70 factor (sigma-E family)
VTPTIDEFVAVRGPALLRLALMLTGQRPAAEDLVQSVLVRAYPRWSRIAAMEHVEAYLKRMLVNEHLRWRRRLARDRGPASESERAGAGTGAAPDASGAYASRDAAWALLARLPRRQRAVLVLRYYEDLADAEIATILGCRESTVRSQAARGLAALRATVSTMEKEMLP